MIDADGNFVARFAGTWGDSDRSDRRGWLRGRWVDRNDKELGQMKGHWHSGRPNDGRGHMHGRWAKANVDADGNTGD